MGRAREATRQLAQLIERDNNTCHYCGRKCNRESRNATPSRDHIVPASMGGADSLDNYVLACRGCNSDRGDALFYCKCRSCKELIYDALYDPEYLSVAFAKFVRFHRPVVKKHHDRDGLPWSARLGHVHRYFKTFEEALNYALNGSFMKGE